MHPPHSRTLQHKHCNTMQHTQQHTATHTRQHALQHSATHTRRNTQHQIPCASPHITATHYKTLQHIARHCNTLQHKPHASPRIAAAKLPEDCNNLLPHAATHCNTLQHTATQCNSLLHTATLCNILQHSATHSYMLQHTAKLSFDMKSLAHAANRAHLMGSRALSVSLNQCRSLSGSCFAYRRKTKNKCRGARADS